MEANVIKMLTGFEWLGLSLEAEGAFDGSDGRNSDSSVPKWRSE